MNNVNNCFTEHCKRLSSTPANALYMDLCPIHDNEAMLRLIPYECKILDIWLIDNQGYPCQKLEQDNFFFDYYRNSIRLRAYLPNNVGAILAYYFVSSFSPYSQETKK